MDAREVAARLTDAQKRGVMAAHPFAFGAYLLPLGTARGLAPLGVAVRTFDGMCLTPFGLEVRAILMEEG